MSDARAWLASREPSPPEALRARLDGVDVDGAPLHEALTGSAIASLSAARAEPGRVRASAFHLLVADALVTYACEAALEAEDPAGALSDILARAADEPR